MESDAGADGGGGAALGGAVFVRGGGTLILRDTASPATYSVAGGTTPGQGGATAGEAHGSMMFLLGTGTTVFDVAAGDSDTISSVGPGAIAGTGGLGRPAAVR